MSFREIVIEKQRIEYEGLFDAHELHHIIDYYFREKGYDKRETRNMENTTPEGKYVEIEITPWKKTTDYHRNIIKMKIYMSKMRDVEVEKDNTKIKLQNGRVQFVIDAFLEYDYDDRWENKPIHQFIRTLFDKYFYKPYTDKYKGVLLEDTRLIVDMIKRYFNLFEIYA
ncbi:hypothetical protein COY28_03145 [Candidatus Woesearchaeota archaeon CG_4_10_14_0_2_um_filter_57_5]|nr:MAG: hypothetical protein AUJ68_04040 [Candidatus Woesearchaeota archaeon CG1_02_57_44]PIN67825.1 MAG: hypothetical protein COV94_06655 [Candidatus Woesearchaeota archaeon CG11_big_fil_rev_8_21_14_0_20_57_5]PIZ53928.1 MAG: hypothetical protein COY28_03145 [Candidatus Woesearchaeota archaeon CG_4_10_14_0_2_um_filter_57_5]